MCGRFQLSVRGKEISERFNTEVFDEMYKPSYNCAPTQLLSVITNSNPNRLQFFHWGLVPSWAKDTRIGVKMINSRAETIAEKPSFKRAFAARRCLIPANGFYEWKKQGQKKLPYRFMLRNESLFAMAGIWETWHDSANNVFHSFSIITTSANSLMKQIHHRMPVILRPEHEQLWLGDTESGKLLELLKPYPDGLMEYYAVSPKLNSARNEGPDLIAKYETDSNGQIPGLID